MSMLIEGPKQPGNDINLYLGLLKEELDTLWKMLANRWDVVEKGYFPMRAALHELSRHREPHWSAPQQAPRQSRWMGSP